MKQQIVVKVQMNCGKCRSKALQIAASVNGVSEVKLEGDERDQVAVTGEDVDTVGLTRTLKKKVGHATIVSVAVIQDPTPPPPPPPPPPVVETENNNTIITHYQHSYPYPYPYPSPWYSIPYLVDS